MRTFYYVHTGHRIGLDRFRRAAAIISYLGDDELTLLSSDFRIAQIARDFGVKNSVGLDVVRNIPQIAHHGDKLVFDSDEANPIMLEDMQQYFFPFIHVANDTIAVADRYFEKREKTVKLSYFFGDDDYEKDLAKNLEDLKSLNVHLQLGFYYFLDYEDMLREEFTNCFDFEEYDEMIFSSEVLITSSPQAVLESLASGGKPIYIQREDYTRDMNDLFKKLEVPCLESFDINQINVILKTINDIKYVTITQNDNKMSKIIKENLNL